MRAFLLLPLLFGCQEVVVQEEDTGDGFLRLASIKGNIELGTPYTEDGRGSMLIFVTIISNKDGVMPHRVLVDSTVDVTPDDYSMQFEITNLFPQDEPYYIGAFFDEDFSMVNQLEIFPTSGDLASWPNGGLFEEIVVGSGEEKHVLLTLDHEWD